LRASHRIDFGDMSSEIYNTRYYATFVYNYNPWMQRAYFEKEGEIMKEIYK
jgi:hypothetical protein